MKVRTSTSREQSVNYEWDEKDCSTKHNIKSWERRLHILNEKRRCLLPIRNPSPQLFDAVLIVSLSLPVSFADGVELFLARISRKGCRTACRNVILYGVAIWGPYVSQMADGVKCSANECYRNIKPVVTYRFPEETVKDSISPEFFFPDFTHDQSKMFLKEEFVIVLTNDKGARSNAYCAKFLSLLDDGDSSDSINPSVLVVISSNRNDVFYLNLVSVIKKHAEKSQEHLTCFLSSIAKNDYPQKRGASLVVVERYPACIPNRTEIVNNGTALGRSSSSKIIERISPEITACVIAALLAERRILLVDHSVCTASEMVHVMEALIQPLIWPYVFIPVIPDTLSDLTQNPTPYLMGILRKNIVHIRDLIVSEQCTLNDIDPVMLLWYASIFGHYTLTARQCEWGSSSFNKRLVEMQPDKMIRPYLSYLCETVMFQEWIMNRLSKQGVSTDPLPGTVEYQSGRIDKLYSAGVNCFTAKPSTKVLKRVANILKSTEKGQ
ncbi:unnamed protein product [Nippostrongylus brasiliensis]|uniref:UDENN domain-containing protein n=1 Tax=Nippostrongylus brasiliensis TaxID=27835 RepID=A0A0N4Y3N6_NIPBR|nr:unnamed protein product [Nippostrongylus brasiliensis]